MKLHMEKIKCALNTSPRLQSQRSPLLLMELKEAFRTMETKGVASPALFLSLLFCMLRHIQCGGRGQTMRLTVRADHC